MKQHGIIACLFLLLGSLLGCQKKETAKSPAPVLAWGFSLDGFPISTNQLEQLNQETKIAPQIIQFYLQWPSSPTRYDPINSSLEVIANAGAVPCITWEPMTLSGKEEKAISYELILNGEYDDYLNAVAQEIKKWNKPMIIRLAQEMNLKRYHWGTNQEQYGPQSPEIYIKIFRYIVDVFNKQNVKNVLWAFCPNVDSDPNESWNQAKHYYPGNSYVDLLGMDGYNWAITQEVAAERQLAWIKPWLSFEELFSKLYQELKAIHADKPIIVFETASVNRGDGQKSLWIQEALKTAKKWELTGIIWFQVKKEEDWRIQQNEDYRYVPAIRSATSPFYDWMLDAVKDHDEKIIQHENYKYTKGTKG